MVKLLDNTFLKDMKEKDYISRKLLPYQYERLHYDSPDARGIDVALLYQKIFFDPSQRQGVVSPVPF